MISRNQGDDTFAAFQPMGIFHFWEDGEIHFFSNPSIFLGPHLQPSQFFCDETKVGESRGL